MICMQIFMGHTGCEEDTLGVEWVRDVWLVRGYYIRWLCDEFNWCANNS